ncbi:MAG: ATP-grasp domain-containing protein [Acidobacteriota bacterium]|nr:ATP-grasp domain-containing protein [Acidobacteriota bacterium]
MNVLLISPGFPDEMPLFTAGLAASGARVIGIGDQPQGALPMRARHAISHYLQVPTLWDEEGMVQAAQQLDHRFGIERVECLWEPGILVAARIRDALQLPGMSYVQCERFRDKEKMKQRLDECGIRTPRHAAVRDADGIRAAAERIGYPLIIKPVAGAGSADTHRVDDAATLERIIPQVRHVDECSVEEFIEGEEYTFDTICAKGEMLYHNISWYRPRPLIGRTLEWMSPQTLSLRDVNAPNLGFGEIMGRAVLKALEFESGFTHMEWFRTASGEAVFGEIAARPPGAHSVDLMNYACDIDTFTGWAEAVTQGRLSQTIKRRYNSAIIFKRAQGQGSIKSIQGLERLVARFRPNIVCVDLLPIGSPRRNWKQTLLSDGHVILRHPDLTATMEMADRVGTDVVMKAG